MLKEQILLVNYLNNGVLSVIPTKVCYELSIDEEIKNIHYEMIIENQRFISKTSNVTELAIKNLQKILPENIKIACCQSCRYGNFCPYGDNENEVFCLKDMRINNKNDVCDIFSLNENYKAWSRKLLDFCTNYKPISKNEYYTYNDWD